MLVYGLYVTDIDGSYKLKVSDKGDSPDWN